METWSLDLQTRVPPKIRAAWIPKQGTCSRQDARAAPASRRAQSQDSRRRKDSGLRGSITRFHGALLQLLSCYGPPSLLLFCTCGQNCWLRELNRNRKQIDLCGSRRAKNILKNHMHFNDDAPGKLYHCQAGFSFSIHCKASKRY